MTLSCASETLQLTVTDIVEAATGIRAFELRSGDVSALPAFDAGDHIDVHTPCGVIRQYSLYNSPAERERYCIAVKLEEPSRGGSHSMHRDLKIGTVVKVSRPRSNFRLQPAGSYMLFAGGIGITPILSMAHHLETVGAKAVVNYFIRDRQHAAFLDELSLPRQHVQVVIHDALGPAQVKECFRAAAHSADADAHAYICGPAAFMSCAQDVLTPHLGEQAVHLEFFRADELLLTGTKKAFRVRLVKSSIEVQVEPDETILEVVARHGIKVSTSCQQGVCGTCVVKVLAGTPDHRDKFLSEFHKKANKKMAVCVSRSLSDVIDIDL